MSQQRAKEIVAELAKDHKLLFLTLQALQHKGLTRVALPWTYVSHFKTWVRKDHQGRSVAMAKSSDDSPREGIDQRLAEEGWILLDEDPTVTPAIPTAPQENNT